MKRSGEIKKLPKKLKGYLLVWSEQGFDSDGICIYGDSKGLKSLGEALIALAELDQKKLRSDELPSGDSYHQHFRTFCGVDEDAVSFNRDLRIGRVEEKESDEIRECFPPRKK